MTAPVAATLRAPRVMVDELQAWPGSAKTGATRTFGDGKESCHLTISPGAALDALHGFAAKIGMKREWFQEHATAPHYDLTPKRRAAALLAGAVFVRAKEQARDRVEWRFSQRILQENGR